MARKREGQRVTESEQAGAENVPPLAQGTPPEVDPIMGDDVRTNENPRTAEEVGGHPDAGDASTGAPVIEVPQDTPPSADDSEEETMRVRVLIEQNAVTHPSGARRYLPSGQEADLPQLWAKELLSRGEAEPVAVKPADNAENRPSQAQRESR